MPTSRSAAIHPTTGRNYRLALVLVSIIGLPFLIPGMTTPAFASGSPVGTVPAPENLQIPVREIAALDFQAARLEDEEREAQGLPPRFALREDVWITPDNDGIWTEMPDRTRIWRLEIRSPGALSLNLGFTGYHLPEGARLSLYPSDRIGTKPSRSVINFDHNDNKPHRQLWTPVILGDMIMVELNLSPDIRSDFELHLTAINSGYRYFGESIYDKAGSCNIDVICSEGDPWRDEINSVGLISLAGNTLCAGTMLNNTAADMTPYFVTANHCNLNLANAPSLVVYWNFQSPTCGQQGGGSYNDFQTGSTFLATSISTDFTLVLLDDLPDTDHYVTYAGWDRRDIAPLTGTTIHFPQRDEKSISFDFDPLTITSYSSNISPGNGTHLRIGNWELGTTEHGSSGAPLFDQNHRFVGQLHGGLASCTFILSDWYGRFALSWNTIASYLDPAGTGLLFIDTVIPPPHGMKVLPDSSITASGPFGGPFTPTTLSYKLFNRGLFPIIYQVNTTASWLDISATTGTLAAADSVLINFTVNATALAMSIGKHTAWLQFSNLSDGDGNTSIQTFLQIGLPELVYSFDMDTNPGWSATMQWEYGVPLGGGGSSGFADPISGFTGTQVYGYDLSGDYTPNLPEQHLISTPLDCSKLLDVKISFRRWLGVEDPLYDHVKFSVSNNGISWTTIWSNTAEVQDNSWQFQQFNIAPYAERQRTVYLRWTMGSTDGGQQYCGWNLDDVEIWAVVDPYSTVNALPASPLLLANSPNPFNPSTRIEFSLAEPGFIILDIFDPRGRRIRRLVSGSREAGRHRVVWDGTGDDGRALGSGVYTARLSNGDRNAGLKMLLLK